MKRYHIYAVAGIMFFTVSFSACAKENAASPDTGIKQAAPVTALASSQNKINQGSNANNFRNAIINVTNKIIPSVAHIEVTQSQEVQESFHAVRR